MHPRKTNLLVISLLGLTAAGVAGVEAFIINGVVVMPSFANMLTPEQTRLTAEYVVNCLQGAQPDACP